MLTRKTQFAWMTLGGLICLFGVVLTCKLHDGNRAIAQLDQPAPSPTPKNKEPLPSIFSLPPTLQTKEPEQLPPPKKSEIPPAATYLPYNYKPELLLPPKKADKGKEPAGKGKSTQPKATLEMPLPSEPSLLMPPKPMRDAAQSPTLRSPSPVLPTAFDPTNRPSKPPRAKEPVKQAPTEKPLPPPSAANKAEKKVEQSNPSLGWTAPGSVVPSSSFASYPDEGAKTQPGEPPLAPAPGPVQIYRVRGTETLSDIARRTLGSSQRWTDLHKLNPTLKPDEPLRSGTIVRLPADACIQTDDVEPVKPLPILRSKPQAPKAKVLPLTGTYQCSLDDKGRLTLPRAIRDQLGGSDTVLLSPGPDKCLWLTDHPHLERLGERLDQSQANEADVRVFKRLYFAQTEKLSVNSDGRVTVPERLGQFAELHQEVVLVGIDDHFEVWDAARWRSYTQQKSTTPSALTEPE